MRVLHVYKTSMPNTLGGIENCMHVLCNATADLGVDNTILSLASNPQSSPINMGKYTVVQAKQNLYIASTGFSINAFTKFKQLLKNTDLVHYHFPNPFADMLHFACQVKKPSIVTYHSDILRQKYLKHLYQPLMDKFLTSVNKIIATSPKYAVTSKILQRYTHKLEIIPLGLPDINSSLLNQEKINYWKQKLPEKFFLFIGSMRYYKGLKYALQAMKLNNATLVLIGSRFMQESLEKFVKKQGIRNVCFLGNVSEEDKYSLLHLCYAFLFPSNLRTEAFGMSLLEAAMYGKPLISCEIGTGTSYVNLDQHTGLVIAPSSAQAIYNAMQYLLNNPDKCKEFGLNARSRSQQLFTASRQAQSYLKVYNDLL